jgi:2-haloacid dehalogenase
MQRYDWLLFDADGTLFDFERAESAALRQVFQRMGVAFLPDYLVDYKRINQTLWRGVETGAIKPGFVKTRRFELLLQSLSLDHSPDVFSAAYLDCLAECSELIEDAAEVVQALKDKYRMAILTNGLKVVQHGRLARSVIRPHIQAMVISEEIGFSKPAKEFFEIAMCRLGNPAPCKVLMIGDSWNSDIVGAVQYGLDACWYNPGRRPRPTGCELAREIASLRDLTEWLG